MARSGGAGSLSRVKGTRQVGEVTHSLGVGEEEWNLKRKRSSEAPVCGGGSEPKASPRRHSGTGSALGHAWLGPTTFPRGGRAH